MTRRPLHMVSHMHASPTWSRSSKSSMASIGISSDLLPAPPKNSLKYYLYNAKGMCRARLQFSTRAAHWLRGSVHQTTTILQCFEGSSGRHGVLLSKPGRTDTAWLPSYLPLVYSRSQPLLLAINTVWLFRKIGHAGRRCQPRQSETPV